MSEHPRVEFMKQLVEKYRQMMYKIAFGILRNSYDAEDAIQSALLWIINNYEKFLQIPCNKRAVYIANIIEHVSINILNKKKRHPFEDIDEHREISCNISVDKSVAEKMTIEEIKQVILTMSETDRLILRLCLFEERNNKEIAKIMGISEENARVRIHRVKKRLANLLKKRGITNEY